MCLYGCIVGVWVIFLGFVAFADRMSELKPSRAFSDFAALYGFLAFVD